MEECLAPIQIGLLSLKCLPLAGDEKCPVEACSRVYRQHRPEFMLERNSPFYIQAIVNPVGNIWFKNQRLGVNSLRKILKEIGVKAGLSDERTVRNHSGRKTMLNDLCEANVPVYRIIQLSGHKKVNSIEDYHKNTIFKHQEEMSRILSDSSNASTTDDTRIITKTQRIVETQSSIVSTSSVPQMQLFGAHTTITGGNFTINIMKEKQSANLSSPERKEVKRIRQSIDSSDSSQE